MSPPLIPSVRLRRDALWKEFLGTPGTLEVLLGHLEAVKQGTDKSEKEQNSIKSSIKDEIKESKIDSHEMSIPVSEDDFQPLSESSHIPTIVPSSPRSPFPPMSPRCVSPSTITTSPRFFYLDHNIDQVPDRNGNSPRAKEEKLVSIKVQVIKSTVSNIPGNITVRRKSGKAISSLGNISIADALNINTPSPRSTKSSPSKESILPFYPLLLPQPVLPSNFISQIQQFFCSQPDNRVTPESCDSLARHLGFPTLIRIPLFIAVFGSQSKTGNCSQFLSFWQSNSRLLYQENRDNKLFHILCGCKADNITWSQLEVIARDVLHSHPQLQFFFESPDCLHLHSRYIETVVASIMFQSGGWRRRVINKRQFHNLHLFDTLTAVETSDDLNMLDHFSYDLFYVLCRKFVSLDKSCESGLSRRDLLDYDEPLTRKVVDRVFIKNVDSGLFMEYVDWVYFVMAEVDKSMSSSIDYWFTVLDTDEDGLLSLTEMKTFYCESLRLLITADFGLTLMVRWDDMVTQILDTTKCSRLGGIDCKFSLMDLKRNAKFPHILNVFINVVRFVIDDENEIVHRSDLSPIQAYVLKCLADLEADEE